MWWLEMVRIWAACINEYLPYVKSFHGSLVVWAPVRRSVRAADGGESH